MNKKKTNTCEANTAINPLVPSLLLMAVGVVGLFNGFDMLDATWLLLGGAYLVGGTEAEAAKLRWYLSTPRGVLTFVLLLAAMVLMLIEIMG